MNERDYWTVEAMEAQGGSFVKALANCARMADPLNLALIKATWPEYWKEYEDLGIGLESQNV